MKDFQTQKQEKKKKTENCLKYLEKKNMEFIKEFEYQFEAIEYIQKEFDVNVSPSHISSVLNKNIKSTKGFVFEYI